MEELIKVGSIVAAPQLVGALIVYVDGRGQKVNGRIVETEAYPPNDPSTYKFTGKKLSRSAHFADAGTIFMHFSHGAYNCLNIACGEAGTGDSLLIRAIEPMDGLGLMWHNRYGELMPDKPLKSQLHNLTSGPGKLIQAFGLKPELNGALLGAATSGLTIVAGSPPANIVQTSRVGLTKGAGLQLRWYDADSPFVSRR